ncbi:MULTISPECIES: helix-turn-helix transcriptional regulator [unclassified Rhodococcus (in: high G+C Gram-positive bacteria)]|uniref:helix-turn-helix domain-containing protein n=1 Tax=Rhodococcus sp. NCIMB 12038 TaxID=933800 RepID=UPI001C502298
MWLDDLDKICAALDCTVADLLEAEPLAATTSTDSMSAGPSEEGANSRGRRPGEAEHDDRYHQTDPWHPAERTGRSRSAQSVWAGAKDGNTLPAPPARSGDKRSRNARPAGVAGITTMSTTTDSAAPAYRSCASTIRVGCSTRHPGGRCNSP